MNIGISLIYSRRYCVYLRMALIILSGHGCLNMPKGTFVNTNGGSKIQKADRVYKTVIISNANM